MYYYCWICQKWPMIGLIKVFYSILFHRILVRILNFRRKILVLDNFSGICSDYMQEANALGRLCSCTCSSELSLLAYAISTKNNHCLFYLILYVPVNNFLVMSGRVFLGWTSTIQWLMCFIQANNNVAATFDFQQCGILTSVDSDEPVQPPFKLKISN